MDFSSMDISAAGMRAQRLRMDVIARNVAQMETTSVRTEAVRTPDGGTAEIHAPYRRQRAVLEAGPGGLGVVVTKVVEDPSPLRAEHDPGHPHAVPAASGREDAGTVYYPNVSPLEETVDMIAASRAYEANLTAVEVFKAMSSASLRLLA
jgi:flagellar basal-body rod protein FlgC